MSHFSAALDSIMRERRISQRELGDRAEIAQAQLSRYINADTRPELDVLDRLCSALGVTTDGAALAIAYLRDEIPPSVRTRIEISAISLAIGEPVTRPDVYDRLPKKVRALIDDLCVYCERSPQLVVALQSTVDLLR